MLSSDQLAKVGNFDQDTIDALAPALGSVDSMSAAGAITLKTHTTRLAVSGTMAFTLANGSVAGQRKRIVCESAASTPAGTVTITTPDDTAGHVCAGSFVFDTAGQAIELVWTGSKWRCVRVERAGTSGANGVVVGTTSLVGKNLWINYCLSVTGTVSSTGNNALPNGSAKGERVVVNVTTAASIPSGSVNGTFRTIAGANATAAGGLDATADTFVAEWDGTRWQVLYSTGVTFS